MELFFGINSAYFIIYKIPVKKMASQEHPDSPQKGGKQN